MNTQASGSTLTGIVVDKTTVFIFNIGDSRTSFGINKEAIYFLNPVFNTIGIFQDELNVIIIKIRGKLFLYSDHNTFSEIEKKTYS
jgi:hypothetical protein